MRRLVTTSEGEVRMPSTKTPKRIMPVRQHLGLPSRPTVKGGTTPDTAPFKTDLQHFDSKHGWPNLGDV